jgi:ankyrin repeat protein
MNHNHSPVRGSAVLASVVISLLIGTTLDSRLFSQAQATIDFARDIQPILTERCIGCHGPAQQMNGYRLDRRSAALGGVLRPNIVPGSSESSRLYRRITGSQTGPQMPPTGALPQDEIDLLKQWIDQGAQWPEALANEADLPPADPAAIRTIDAIRSSDRTAVVKQLTEMPSVVNKPGPGGSTPLMYAALDGDPGLVAEMLRAGADPNTRNHVGATALMWALENVETVRVLLNAGADANATSDFGRSPLTLAAAQAGSAPVVKLLLDRGAAPRASALTAAALRGDAPVVRLLVAAGARDTGAAAIAALRSNCRECLDAIGSAQTIPPLRNALINLLPAIGPGNAGAVREALDRGADVGVKDAKARTVLMRAAIVDTTSQDVVQLLIDRGADPHATSPDGLTALDFARRLGRTRAVDVLTKAGATSSSAAEPTLKVVHANTIRAAVQRSLPLLQRTALQFYQKSGCVSCHHNSLTEITVAAARQQGFIVDEHSAQQDLTTVVKDIGSTRDQALQGIVVPGGFVTTTGYVLMGLSAEHHQADAATDALVRLLRLTQQPDGHWSTAYRPPFEASEFSATAVSLRGIQLYGPSRSKGPDENAIRAAASWLANARPETTEDRVFRLLGLAWTHASPALRQSALRDLVETQRADGGWAQLTSLHSDAYATGAALLALSEAGMRSNDAAYRRGVRFLLTTQLVDGSWLVRTRSHPTQIYFESGFPHGIHQYISTAATNWATLALLRAQAPTAARTLTRTSLQPQIQ